MLFAQDIVYSAKTLLAAKSRTFLTMLGVLIGVMSVVAVSSVGDSAEDFVLGQIKAFGTNAVSVLPGGSKADEPPPIVMGVVVTTLTERDFRALRDLPHVIAGSPLVSAMEAVTLDQRSVVATINGAGEEIMVMRDATLAEGRIFDRQDVEGYSRVAVLGAKIAADLAPGGSVIGRQIRIKNNGYQVIGVLEEKGSSFGPGLDKDIFIPVTTAQKLVAGISHVNAISLKVDSAWNIDRVTLDIQETLRRRHNIRNPDKDDFSVRSGNQAISLLSGVTGAISAFLVLVTAISLLVGGINIMNIMYVAVRERTREIGLRKALGAKPRRILMQFLMESSMISFAGGLAGLLLGILIAYGTSFVALNYGLNWNFLVSSSAVVVALSVSIGIGLIFGVAPARAAARLDAIDALRYE